jgi:hypothetical protein
MDNELLALIQQLTAAIDRLSQDRDYHKAVVRSWESAYADHLELVARHRDEGLLAEANRLVETRQASTWSEAEAKAGKTLEILVDPGLTAE